MFQPSNSTSSVCKTVLCTTVVWFASQGFAQTKDDSAPPTPAATRETDKIDQKRIDRPAKLHALANLFQNDEALQLPGSSAAFVSAVCRPIAEFECDVIMPAFAAEGESADMEIGFVIVRSGKLLHYSAVFDQRQTAGKTISQLRLHQVATDGAKVVPYTERTVEVPADRTAGRWRFQYDRGLLTVYCGNKVLAESACDFGIETLVGLLIGSKTGKVSLKNLVYRGLEARKPNMEEQAADAEIGQLSSTLTSLMREGKPDEAVLQAEQLVALARKYPQRHAESLPFHLINLAAIYGTAGQREVEKRQAQAAVDAAKELFGNRHPLTAQFCNLAAEALRNAGFAKEALPLQRQALALREELFGAQHAITAESLDNLGLLFQETEQFNGALTLHERALELYEASLGPEANDTLLAASNFAACLTKLKDFERAIAIRKRILAKYEKTHDMQSQPSRTALQQYLIAVDKRSEELIERSQLVAAHAVLHEALSKDADYLTSTGTVVFTLFGRLARVLSEHGQCSTCRMTLERLCDTFEASLKLDPVEDEAAARVFSQLGSTFLALQNFPRATPQLRRALKIQENLFGIDTPQCAATLVALADLDSAQDRYLEANELYRRAISAAERDLTHFHEQALKSVVHLAINLANHQDEDAAELLLRMKFRQYAEHVNKYPFLLALGTNTLGAIYGSRSNYTLASRFYEASWRSFHDQLGVDHTQTGIARNNWGLLLSQAGMLAEAEDHLLEAKRVFTLNVGKEHPLYANVLNNLGIVYSRQDRTDEALTVALEVLRIRESILGPLHQLTILAQSNLGLLYYKQDEVNDAKRFLNEAIDRRKRVARDVLPGLPETESIQFLKQWQSTIGPYLSVLHATSNPDSNRIAYDTVWEYRGAATRAIAARRPIGKVDELSQLRFAELQQVRRELSRLLLAVPRETPTARANRLHELTVRKESLERQLAQLLPVSSRSGIWDGNLVQLMSQLPKDTVLVDLLETDTWSVITEPKRRLGSVRAYEAFIIRPALQTGLPTVEWVHLGEAEPIDTAVANWKQLINAGKGGRGLIPVSSDSRTVAHTPPQQFLRETIWDKLEPYFHGAKTVVLIPDGDLCGVPWNALPASTPDHYLLEEYCIVTVPYAQQLLHLLPTATPGTNNIFLAGGITYNAIKSAPAEDVEQLSRGVARVRGEQLKWNYLPGTLSEVEQIATLAGSRQVLTLQGENATERNVRRQLPAYNVAHLATHGFFAHEKFESSLGLSRKQRASVLYSEETLTQGRNPLTLTGLVLAGADSGPDSESGADDNILSAEEVVSLDLRNMDLVVLSACETGLGAVAGGEGVMGLNRAFAMAGARSTIVSLWRVDDETTAALMIEFYKNLWGRNLSKSEALRQAQISLLRGKSTGTMKGEALPPRLWAAFTLSGDWR